MEIKQLQNFCKVVELGSLTAAARKLDLTQAALSRQLAMLEAEFDVKLFRRTGRGLIPTPAGRRLQEQAYLILQQVAQVPRAVQGAADSVRGELALGLPPSIARTVMVPLVEAFRAEIPGVAMRAVDGLSANLVELVATGKLDCAIVYMTAPTDKVVFTPLTQESLYLLSGPVEGPELGASVPLSQVVDLPLAVPGRDNPVHAALCVGFARLGKTPHVVHQVTNLAAIHDLVRKGYCYAVIPLSGVHACIGDKNLRKV
jgi:LysR family nitrogen assimilation transcriptional regulator